MSTTTEQTTPAPRTTQSLTPQVMNFTHAHIIVRHTTDTGKMLPRRITGLSAKQQRHVSRTIKQARNLLIMQ
jgi:small subunit ribosomal protein S18